MKENALDPPFDGARRVASKPAVSPGDGAEEPGSIIAIVPVWNAVPRIESHIDALADQVDALIFVDNASRDETLTRLRARQQRSEAKITIIENAENRGWPAAVNQGIDRALEHGARFVLLANDDICFAPGAVKALAMALIHDPLAAATTARTVYRDRPHILNGAGGRYEPDRVWAALRGEGEADEGHYDTLTTVDYPSGAACLLRAELLHRNAIGRFDEAYYLYFEDVDWGLRAARQGWHTRYVAASLALHEGSAGTARDPERRRYYNLRNRLRFASLHASPAARRRVWRETLQVLAIQPLRALWPRRRRGAKAVTLAVLDHLRGRYGKSDSFG